MSGNSVGWLEGAFSYTTVKVVKIYNWKLGLVHHSIQLLIVLYIVGFVLFVDSGYQSQSPVIGYSASKVKGSATQQVPGSPDQTTVWDATDAVVPPLEPNAVFITTNTINTYGQTRGSWIDPTVSNCAACNGSLDYGFYTGCQNGTCYYQGWGPYPSDSTVAGNVLQQVQSWTVFIRCFALFSDYNIRVDNLGNSTGPNNLFTVSDMLAGAGTSFADVATLGTVISMNIDWTCAFDWWSRPCVPKFTYTRLDDPNQSFSNGFNFRYANYYSYPNENGTVVQYRDLIKAYGIRFSFLITGVGRKFSIVPLLLNVGSGLGLLVVATVICDLLALYVFPQKRKYEKAKFKDIRPGDSVNYTTDFPDETTDIINNASKARLY